MTKENSQKSNDSKQERFKDLINCGTEITGGMIGAALGSLAAGPVGAATLGAIGSLAAIALRKIGQDVSERMLGPREKVRIGAVLALASTEIKSRIDAGENIRSDGFFDPKEFGRSNAEEVAESILLKCQREPEEKKLPYMSHLLVNISFDAEINVAKAHQLIKAAEQLTFRQLCILKLTIVKEHYNLRDKDYRGTSNINLEILQILYECYDLYQKAYINNGGNAAISIADLIPSAMKAQGFGVDLFLRMRLFEIPDSELIPISEQLKM